MCKTNFTGLVKTGHRTNVVRVKAHDFRSARKIIWTEFPHADIRTLKITKDKEDRK